MILCNQIKNSASNSFFNKPIKFSKLTIILYFCNEFNLVNYAMVLVAQVLQSNKGKQRKKFSVNKVQDCFAIITNDLGHYNNFLGVRVFSPTDIPYMKKYLKQKN